MEKKKTAEKKMLKMLPCSFVFLPVSSQSRSSVASESCLASFFGAKLPIHEIFMLVGQSNSSVRSLFELHHHPLLLPFLLPRPLPVQLSI